MNLRGVKVLITGGTSGIGLKLVDELILEKAKVIVVSRNKEKLQLLKQDKPIDSVYACDLSNPQEVISLSEKISQHHPDLQVLINNAGIQHNIRFDEETSTSELILSEVNTNFLAPLLLTRGLLPVLTKQTQAVLVNMSSGLALTPKYKSAVYCGTKGGLHIFSKALRIQYDPQTLRVIEILPPAVDTPMTAGRGRKKIAPEMVAKKTIDAITNRKKEVYVHKTKILYWLNRLSPTLAQQLMKQFK